MHTLLWPHSSSCALLLSSAVRRRQAVAAAAPATSSSSSPRPASSSTAASSLGSLPAPSSALSSSSSDSALRWLSEVSGVPAVWFALGLLALLLLLLLQGWGMRALTFFVGFLYPLHRSLRALASSPSACEEQRLWLMYWLVWGLFSFAERLSDSVLWWLPLYAPAKLTFLLWCFLPQWQGCCTLYDVFLQPLLARHRQSIDKGVEEVTEVIGVVGAHVIRQGRKASLLAASRGGQMLSNLAAVAPAASSSAHVAE